MKIGIYFGNENPESGGAYSVLNSIFNELKTLEYEDEIFIFGSNIISDNKSNVKYIDINKFEHLDNKIHINEKSLIQKLKDSISYRIAGKIINEFAIKINNLECLISELKSHIILINGNEDFNNPLNKAVKNYNIDFIWFPTPKYEPVQVPYIYTIWDLGHIKYPMFPEVSVADSNWQLRENLNKAAINKASFIVTGTESGKEQISRFYLKEKKNIFVNPLPVSNKYLNSDFEGIKPDKFDDTTSYIFYPAQFWAHKNHKVILDAIFELKEKGIIIKAYFCGSDKYNLHYIDDYAIKKGINNQLINLGFITNEELVFLYKNAICLVFPSLFGPDNIPPLEAMALGCPVILSLENELHDYFHNAVIGFDPLNPKELAIKIEDLLLNNIYRDDIIQLGFQYVKEKSAKNYILKTIDLFNEFKKYRVLWGEQKNLIGKVM